MPIQLVCGGCGAIIYEDNTPNWYADYLYTVVHDKLHGKCPRCKKKLFPPLNIKVIPQNTKEHKNGENRNFR